MPFPRLTVGGLASDIRARRVSATEIAEHYLRRIERLDPGIGAFVAVDAEQARADAAGIDARLARGEDCGPLAGVPLAVKDLEDARGFVTGQGSWLTRDDAPADRDSLLVARLRAAGCVIIGKTNLSEFAVSPHTANARFGATRNPWNPAFGAGGSSGGSAAAIAADLVPLATGSDGGGSIRIPASCCGLSAIKTSLGRVPDGDAHPPDWLDLSTKGVLAWRMRDVLAALPTIVGPSPLDPRSLPHDSTDWSAPGERALPPRLGWSPTLGYAPVDDEVRALCEAAVRSLARPVTEFDSIFARDPIRDWLTIVGAGTRRTVAAWPEPLREQLDPSLQSMVTRAASTSATDLIAALDRSHTMSGQLAAVFDEVDLLFTPTVAAAAPPLDLDGAALINGQLDLNWVRFTYPFNMTRSPAATVCVGLTAAGLPVGLQIVGPQHADEAVLYAALAIEAAIGFGGDCRPS